GRNRPEARGPHRVGALSGGRSPARGSGALLPTALDVEARSDVADLLRRDRRDRLRSAAAGGTRLLSLRASLALGEFGQAGVEDLEALVDVVLVEDERRRDADHRLAAAEQEQSLRERELLELADELGGGLLGLAVLHEFHSDEEALAAHVADAVVLGGELARAGEQARAHLGGVGGELVLDELESRERGRAGHG